MIRWGNKKGEHCRMDYILPVVNRRTARMHSYRKCVCGVTVVAELVIQIK